MTKRTSASPRRAAGDRAAAVSSKLPGLARLRARWGRDDALAGAIELGLATSPDAFDQVFRLIHDRYVARGYMDPHPSGWRIGLHNALPTTKVFVARAGERVIGALTLIPDSPLGLPMAEIYADELKTLRKKGRRLAEVSALVVHPDYRRSAMTILIRLIRTMALYAAEVAELTDLCIAVNPRHVALYANAFHFELIGPPRSYGKVNGASAMALRFDLGLVRALIREVREGRHPGKQIYGFLFDQDVCRQVLTGITAELGQAIFSRDQFEYFFLRQAAWLDASPTNRAYVTSQYGQARPVGESQPASGAHTLDFEEIELPPFGMPTPAPAL